MFLSSSVVGGSFLRLRELQPKPKAGVERTTSLFRFLAFDALCKLRGETTLLFDPVTGMGRQNREDLVRQYEQIALIRETAERQQWIVDNLGECNSDGKRTCNNKVTNDFLTAQVKVASESGERHPYPKRPAPLLVLGEQVGGKPWGISKDPDWERNISCFLDDRKSSSIWSDLAVFVTRKKQFHGEDLWEELTLALESIFTSELSKYWHRTMRFEKPRFFKNIGASDFYSHDISRELEKPKYARPRSIDTDELLNSLRLENLELRAENLELRNQILDLEK